MKSLFLTSSLFTVSLISFAQTKPDNAAIRTVENSDNDGGIFTTVEMLPKFSGGDIAWQKFLKDSIQYPENARKQKIEGKVMVKFIVKKDGSIEDIKALSGPEELKQAAIDVVKKSPKWVPGMQNGKKVSFFQIQYITFTLPNK